MGSYVLRTRAWGSHLPTRIEPLTRSGTGPACPAEQRGSLNQNYCAVLECRQIGSDKSSDSSIRADIVIFGVIRSLYRQGAVSHARLLFIGCG